MKPTQPKPIRYVRWTSSANGPDVSTVWTGETEFYSKDGEGNYYLISVEENQDGSFTVLSITEATY